MTVKLYDSYGNLVDVIESYPIDEEDIYTIEDYLDSMDIDAEVRESPCTLTIFQRAEYRGDSLRQPEEKVCGIELLKNFADGKWAGFRYFSASAKTFDDGNNIQKINNSEFICMSVIDTELFPDIDRLTQDIPKTFELSDKDIFSVTKNIYILNRLEDKRVRGKVWDYYQSVRKESTNAHYKDNTIYFKLKDGNEGRCRVASAGNRSCIESNGNFYPSVSSFLNAFRKGIEKNQDGTEYDTHTYGNDNGFRKYALGIADSPVDELEEEKER